MASGTFPSAPSDTVPSAHIDLHIDATQDKKMKTSSATFIMKVIGTDKTLEDYDKLRATLKEMVKKQRPPSHKITRYNKLATKLGQQVQLKDSHISKQIQYIEKDNHNVLPSKTSNKEYSELLKLRKIAKAALKTLNINF